jgi:hypothetical protein
MDFQNTIDFSWATGGGRILGGAFYNLQIDKNFNQDVFDLIHSEYNNKLWIIPNFSLYKAESEHVYKTFSKDGYFNKITGDQNTIKVFTATERKHLLLQSYFENEVVHFLNRIGVPCNDVKVNNHITMNHDRVNKHSFRYFFTFIHSTLGNINPYHGHYSYIDYTVPEKKEISVLQKMTRVINYSNFIYKKFVIEDTNNHVKIDNGKYKATFSKKLSKIIILEDEPTLINILKYFVNKNLSILKRLKVEKVNIKNNQIPILINAKEVNNYVF